MHIDRPKSKTSRRRLAKAVERELGHVRGRSIAHQRRLLRCVAEMLENRLLLSGGPASFATPDPNAIPPAKMRALYGLGDVGSSTITFGDTQGDGSGQTIAIIAANDQPNIVGDANAFSSNYNLPQFNAGNTSPTLTIVNQTGATSPLPQATSDGGFEESLDVEWAHVMAPQADILVVECNDDSLVNLDQGIDTARRASGISVVSISFAVVEFSQETAQDSVFTTPPSHQGVTFIAASGDTGAPADYFSSSPNVMSVGGTVYNAGSETGWSGSSGGISQYESKPSFQVGFVTQSTKQRTTPDVAAVAEAAATADTNGNLHGAVPVYDSFDGAVNAPWLTIGGTSLAAPMWAGLIAVVDQGRVANGMGTLDGATQALPSLYKLPSTDFNDITSGTSTGTPNYSAAPGYDLVTGLGSPVANELVPDLAGLPVIGGFTVDNATPSVGDTITFTATDVHQATFFIQSVTIYQGTAGQNFSQIQNDPAVGSAVEQGNNTTWQLQIPTTGLVNGTTYVYYAIATGSNTSISQDNSSPAAVTVIVGGAGPALPQPLQSALTGNAISNQLGGFLGSGTSPNVAASNGIKPLTSASAGSLLAQITPFLDHDLPIVGNKLDQAITFLTNLDGVIQNAESKIQSYETALDPTGKNAGLAVATALQNELNQLDSTGKKIADSSASSLGVAAANVGVVFFNTSNPSDPNSGTPITGGTNVNVVQFNLDLHGSYTFAQLPVDGSIGLPGLGLSVNSGSTLTIAVGYAIYLHFGFVYNQSTNTVSFYVDTDPARGDSAGVDYLNEGKLLATTPVIGLSLGISLTDPSNPNATVFSGQGSLGPLDLDFRDHKGSTDFYSHASSTLSPTKFAASLGISLFNGGTDAQNNSVALLGLGDDSPPDYHPVVTLSGTASVGLDMELGFDLNQNTPSAYPTIDAELNFSWGFGTSSNPTTVDANDPLSGFGQTPTLQFENVGLNIGTFLSGFVLNVVSDIGNALKPLKPVLDMLNGPMPIFNDFSAAQDLTNNEGMSLRSVAGGGTVTVADFFSWLTGTTAVASFVSALDEITDLSSALSSVSGGNFLNFGNFTVGGSSGRDPRSLLSDGSTADGLSTLTQGTDYDTVGASLASDILNGFTGDAGEDGLDSGSISDLEGGGASSGGGASGAGFSIPLLKDPEQLFQMLLGKQDITLFSYTSPTITYPGSVLDDSFPIFGPLWGVVQGGLANNAVVDFSGRITVGYDTTGLFEIGSATDAGQIAGDLADGFYIDTTPAQGSNPPATFVGLDFALGVGAELNAFVVAAGLGGGIEGSIRVQPVDGTDHKLRFSDVANDPLNLFDLTGEIDAYLDGFIKFGFGPFHNTIDLHFLNEVLLSFNTAASNQGTTPPSLGSVDSNGRLDLLVGADAGSDTALSKDVIVRVTSASITAGSTDPNIPLNTITVSATTVGSKADPITETLSGVKEIVFHGGVGQNRIYIGQGVSAAVYISGGGIEDASVLPPPTIAVYNGQTTTFTPQAQDNIDDEGTGPFYIVGGLINNVIKVGGGTAGHPGWGGVIVPGPMNTTTTVTGEILPTTSQLEQVEGFSLTSGVVQVMSPLGGTDSAFIGPLVYSASITGGSNSDVLDSEALLTTYIGGTGNENFVRHDGVIQLLGGEATYAINTQTPSGSNRNTLVIDGGPSNNAFTVSALSSSQIQVSDSYTEVGVTGPDVFTIACGTSGFQVVDLEGQHAADTYTINDLDGVNPIFVMVNLDQANDAVAGADISAGGLDPTQTGTSIGQDVGATGDSATTIKKSNADTVEFTVQTPAFEDTTTAGPLYQVLDLFGPTLYVPDISGDSLTYDFSPGSSTAYVDTEDSLGIGETGPLIFSSDSDLTDSGTDTIDISDAIGPIDIHQNGHNENINLGYSNTALGFSGLVSFIQVPVTIDDAVLNTNGFDGTTPHYYGTINVVANSLVDPDFGDYTITHGSFTDRIQSRMLTVANYTYVSNFTLYMGESPLFDLTGRQIGFTGGTATINDGKAGSNADSPMSVTVFGSPGITTGKDSPDEEISAAGSGYGVTIYAGSGSDESLVGGDGNDTFIIPAGGNDTVDGGAGNNTVIYQDLPTGPTLTIHASTSVPGALGIGNLTSAEDTIENIQNVVLSAAGDSFNFQNFAGTSLTSLEIDAGTLLATVANAFPATVDLIVGSAGTFNLNNLNQSIGSLAGVGSVILGSAALVTGSDNASTTFSGVISGAGSLTKSGAGTWTLSKPSTYTGPTTINTGTLQSGVVNALPITTDLTIASGAVLNLNNFNQTLGSLSGGGNLILGTATLTTGGDNASTTYSGIISGTGPVTKVGTGTWIVSGASTYTGSTSINAGTVNFNAIAALGAGTAININGATLQYATGNTSDISSRTITIGANGATIDTNGNNVTYANSIGNGGAGAFTKAGSGVLTLDSAGTWKGSTTINGGTLQAAITNVLPNATDLTVNVAGTFDLNSLAQSVGSLSGAGAVTLETATLTSGAGGNANSTTFSGIISGVGILTKIGASVLTLSGTNTYSGGTVINELSTNNFGGDGISVSADANLGAATGTVTYSSQFGCLFTTATFATSRSIYLSTNNFNFDDYINIAAGTTLTDNGVITTLAGSVEPALGKNGLGTLVLNAVNTWGASSGNTDFAINAGTVRSGVVNAIPDVLVSLSTSFPTTAVLDLNGFNQRLAGVVGGFSGGVQLGTITSSSATPVALTIDGASLFDYSGAITGANLSLVVTGSQLFGFNPPITTATNYGGGTTILSGVLKSDFLTTLNPDGSIKTGPLGTGPVTLGATSGSTNAEISENSCTLYNPITVVAGSTGKAVVDGVNINSVPVYASTITMQRSVILTGTANFTGGISGTGNISLNNAGLGGKTAT